MRIPLNYYILIFAVFIFTSCSEDEAMLPPVELDNVELSSMTTYIEEPISITVKGSGYSSIDVKSVIPSNALIIEEVSKNIVEITATRAVKGRIYISLVNENGDLSETETFDVEFYEHGILDFKTIEGIEIDVDKKAKALALLGAPEGVLESSDGKYEFLYYFSKGFSLYVNKGTDVIFASRIYGISWSRNIDGVDVIGDEYPYSLSGIGNFTDQDGLNMDTVISSLGQPGSGRKYASTTQNSTLKWYVYDSLNNMGTVIFYFWADSLDAYQGERVPYLNLD